MQTDFITAPHSHEADADTLAERVRAAADLLEALIDDRGLLAAVPENDRMRLLQAAGRVSRPDAVDSGTSSAAATRTSTGNMTGRACRSTAARSPANASPNASRGTAYSISRNRTRRGLVNTR